MTHPCSCACHGRSDVPCSVLGGCGSEGCVDGQIQQRRRCTGDPCVNMAPGLCRWHRDRVAAELAALPELWLALEDALVPSQGHGDGRGGSEPSLGIRVDVLTFLGPAGAPSREAGTLREGTEGDQVDLRPLMDVLTSWLRLAIEEQFGVKTLAQQRDWTFKAVRAWLVRQHDWICGQPWSDDYAGDLHEVWTTAMSLTGRWESPQPQKGRYCPWCNAGALYQQPGVDEYECQTRAGGCGRRMSRDEYDQMVRMGAAYLRQSGVA